MYKLSSISFLLLLIGFQYQYISTKIHIPGKTEWFDPNKPAINLL